MTTTTSAHGSRRGSARWAAKHTPDPGGPTVDVLIPTAGRTAELATTLAGLAAQDDPPFRVIISDQSETLPATAAPAVSAMLRVLEAQGRDVNVHRHLPRRGMAEQRQFLFERASSPQVLYLDDDVWLEPGTLARMSAALICQRCGFIGSAVQGLSYLDDNRPAERAPFAAWDDEGVRPERVRPGTPEFERWTLHNAANLLHHAAELGLTDDEQLAYRVAWVGGCVLFDRATLDQAGAFRFWPSLPTAHAGEDVAAQWRVMELAGGAGLLPSGAVHLEAPTTIVDRRVDATDIVFATDQRRPAPHQERNAS